MKMQVFLLTLISLIITLPINAMIQQKAAQIPSTQQTTRQSPNQLHDQENIVIHKKTITHNLLIPAGKYTRESLQNWLQQEELNNALWLAVALNKPTKEIVLLMGMGANINHIYNDQRFQSNGKTPLHIAVENHNLEIVSALLQFGANADQKDIAGNSPLDYAIIFKTFNQQYRADMSIDETYSKIIQLLTMCDAQTQCQKYLSIFYPPLS